MPRRCQQVEQMYLCKANVRKSSLQVAGERLSAVVADRRLRHLPLHIWLVFPVLRQPMRRSRECENMLVHDLRRRRSEIQYAPYAVLFYWKKVIWRTRDSSIKITPLHLFAASESYDPASVVISTPGTSNRLPLYVEFLPSVGSVCGSAK